MKCNLLILATVVAVLALAGSASAQPNLIPNLPAGWAWPFVPRPANDATLTSVPAPASLTGDAQSTWLNSAWRNIGTTSSGGFHNRTLWDGEHLLVDRTCPSLAAGVAGQGINGGPFAIPGGRHTFELRVDSGNEVAESNETDNNIAHQWSWKGDSMIANVPLLRAGPPDPHGGWSSIPDGEDKYDNCDGLWFATYDTWDVVYEWAVEPGADYDAQLHEWSTDATSGFKTPIATSTRRGRGLDGVISNGHMVPSMAYDVGFTRFAGSGDYYVTQIRGQALAWGDSLTATFAQNEMLKVYDVPVTADHAGTVSVFLQLATTDPSVILMWVDRTFGIGSLTDVPANVATDVAGRARLDVTAGAAGNYAVIVMRDPDWGTGPRSFGLKVTGALPDLQTYPETGWHSPLVPRYTADGTPSSVAVPDTLPGYNQGPYMNWCLRNSGGLACPTTSGAQLLVDGVSRGTYSTSALPPGGNFYQNSTTRIAEVRAGRHTLAIHANSGAAFPEITADNNAYGEQYCWGPLTEVHLGDMGWDPSPPPLTGGLQDVALGSGETFWYNNQARRLPVAPAGVWWQGYIIAPLPGNDYDLELFEALQGAKNGFGEPLATSGWGSDQTDYVLVNLNLTPRRPFDVATLNYGGTQSHTLQYVESTTLGNAGNFTLAPFTGSYFEKMQLREWYFTQGYWIIRLRNQSLDDRYGMTFHQAAEVYTGKGGGTSVYPAGGGDLWFDIYVATPGWCCLAVWAQDYDSCGNMKYQLSMSPGGSPAPGEGDLPRTTALAGATPNPFNPKTSISFDLAAAGHVRLEIYDLRGALVRTLLGADLAAGRHEIPWDGRDAAGRAVSSGTYLAHFAADGVQQTQKLMLVR